MNMQHVYVSLFLVSSKLNPYSITRYRCAKVENVCIGKHDDVVKWKQFLCYCPFVSGIQRSPVDSPHKGHWHGALTFSLIPVRLNKRLSKRPRRRWFQTLLRSLWCHCNEHREITPNSKSDMGVDYMWVANRLSINTFVTFIKTFCLNMSMLIKVLHRSWW